MASNFMVSVHGPVALIFCPIVLGPHKQVLVQIDLVPSVENLSFSLECVDLGHGVPCTRAKWLPPRPRGWTSWKWKQ